MPDCGHHGWPRPSDWRRATARSAGAVLLVVMLAAMTWLVLGLALSVLCGQ